MKVSLSQHKKKIAEILPLPNSLEKQNKTPSLGPIVLCDLFIIFNFNFNDNNSVPYTRFVL